VSDYLVGGLAAGEPLVIVATPEHRAAFAVQLNDRGFDPQLLQETGRLTILDARETLALFMRRGEPDAELFDTSVGDVLARVQACHAAAPIRVYGEMVDLLWRDGQADAALELEGLWNALARRRAFSLYCAYVMGSFYRVDGDPGIEDVCATHSHVIPESSSEVEALRVQARTLRREVDERRRLESALRAALEDAAASRAQLEALQRIGKALHSELDLERVVQRVTDEATAICHAEFGAFFYNVIDGGGESYTLYTLAGVPREKFSRFPMPRNTDIFGPTFRGEGIVRIDDVTNDPRYGKNAPYYGMPNGHLPVCSYLAIPVVSRTGEVLGGLFFGHSKPGIFTQADENAIVGIAAHAAIAIGNARTYDAERRARVAADVACARTERLQKLTVELSRALGAEDAARIVIGEIRGLLGLEAGGVLVLDGSGARIETFFIDGEVNRQAADDSLKLDLSTAAPLFDAARTGQLVWVVGEAQILERYPNLQSLRRMTGALTWGALPIFFEGRTLGAIGLRSSSARDLTNDEREFLLVLGRQCGQALERARLHDATEASRADAEQASRAKDDFLAMLGHELRNPLSPILTAVQLMRIRGDASSKKEQNVIERQVNHMIHLVDDLLDISRITHGKVELARRPQKLSALVSKAVEVAKPLIDERQHRLSVSIPSADIWLDVDDVRICQVLTNLLTNAAKYTQRHGGIALTAVHDENGIAIRVKDNGSGIAPDLLPSVFDLFVQGFQSADRKQGGLGIGLALVRRLVEMHGGSVSATSDGIGKGSEFVVRLPVIEKARPTVSPEGERSIRERVHVVRRRIVVVDDNEDAAILLGDLLRSVGHEVRTAHDGPSGLELVARFQPEVAILDIGLPGMDGYELAAAIRESGTESIRLMALTGYGQQQDVARAEKAGFAAHFVKPVALARLLTEIEIGGSTDRG
jgi:signal transduction histidine kinase